MRGRAPTARLLAIAAIAATLAVAEPASAALPCTLPGPADPTTTATLSAAGSFPASLEGSYVYVPFDVPPGTTGVRVRYCHDQPENLPGNPLPNSPKHVIDVGVYDARAAGSGLWSVADLRGSTGSAIRDLTISPDGFSAPSVYAASRKGYVSGVTTRGYRPGPIPPGEWAVELGVAAVASRSEGDADGAVSFGVQVELSTDASWSDNPHVPAGYDPAPANPDPGWYAGDFHVHGEQEPGNAPVATTLDYAFGPYGGQGAGLDFVTLLDHNNTVGHGEVGRFQDDYPGKLVMRSTEVTTYNGHIQNHLGGNVDYRAGPLYKATVATIAGQDTVLPIAGPPDRAARPASAIFADIAAAGGFTQINHPTIFPPAVPTFDDFCRGCAWGYDAAETDYSRVDAVEISTGPAGLQTNPNPGPNPFTPLALRFWEDAIDAGGANRNRIAAVGSSDSHQAPARASISPTDATTAPIGMATTVVRAPELSEQGIRAGVLGRHTYVKLWGADGPDVRLRATAPDGEAAIIGDEIAARSLELIATVSGLDAARAARPGAYALSVWREGALLLSVPIPAGSDEFEFSFPSLGPARYRLQVDRSATGGAAIETVSSPIWHAAPRGGGGGGPGPGPGEPGDCEVELRGTGGDDTLRGTAIGDFLNGLGGEDTLLGLGGPDCLQGAAGGDVLVGETGADALDGGSGRDRLRGRAGADRLEGGPHPDRLAGGGGEDRMLAGPGGDVLLGFAGRDVLRLERGRDTARAGAGDDRVAARGGGADKVRCGDGHDTASVDARDRVSGCERVRVQAGRRAG